MSMYSNTTPHTTINLEHYSTNADYQNNSKRSDIILPFMMIVVGCVGLYLLFN